MLIPTLNALTVNYSTKLLLKYSQLIYKYKYKWILACSSHGTCGAFDMCTCEPNFMGNDCSQSKFTTIKLYI